MLSQTFRSSHIITQFVRVSKKEIDIADMFVPSLTHYEFLETSGGALMVTVDVRKSGSDTAAFEAESSLKFWYWDTHNAASHGLSSNHRYKLAAQVGWLMG